MNTSTIHITRDIESVEYFFEVCVTEDAEGTITAKSNEDVPALRWTTRFGGMETEPAGFLKFHEGEVITLNEDEEHEARKAIASAVQYWAGERAKLRAALTP